MPIGSLDISPFHSPVAPSSQVAPDDSSVTRSRICASALAAVASVLIHVCVVLSLVSFGAARKTRLPDAMASAVGKPDAINEPSMDLELIEEPLTSRDSLDTVVALASFNSPPLVPIAVDHMPDKSADVLDQSDNDSVTAPQNPIDQAGRSLLYGRYVGQINARIERAWRRPRTPLGKAPFLCRARVAQDRGGNVLEVTLEQCNGTVNWQLSLVHGIESASPLPAPPDPSVFKRVLTLSFQAEPYSAGAAPDQYEPEMLARDAASIQAAKDERSALGAFKNAMQDSHSTDVIELRLGNQSSLAEHSQASARRGPRALMNDAHVLRGVRTPTSEDTSRYPQ